MKERFGSAFTDVDMRRRGPGSHFMATWERIKRSFGEPTDYLNLELGPLVMRNVQGSEHYDDEEGLIFLTREDVEGIFEPVVSEVISLVRQQFNTVRKISGDLVQRIILTGGFGESVYLFQRLTQWAAGISPRTRVECPEHPQAAIVRGAALRGLDETAPRRKRCRRHYGIAYRSPFREGVDPESLAAWSEWNGAKRCRDRMDWMIKKVGDCHLAIEDEYQLIMWAREIRSMLTTSAPRAST
jgi:hypothetical protein